MSVWIGETLKIVVCRPHGVFFLPMAIIVPLPISAQSSTVQMTTTMSTPGSAQMMYVS